MLHEGRVVGILKLLHSDGVADAECQHVVDALLRSMHKRGDSFGAAVVELLEQFSKSSPALFQSSPLAELYQEIA